jgi:hypothetical protein
MAQASGADGERFVGQQQPGQWLASKLIGTTVVGANNESIGDVNDVLMDRNGHAVGVIIGVGGFLGIGEKDVAVSFNQLEFTSRSSGNASTAATTGSTAATSPSKQPSGATATTGSGTTAANESGVPDRITVRMTKEDLQNAPRFARADQRRDTSTTGSAQRGASDRGTTGSAPAVPGGGNQAPRQ